MVFFSNLSFRADEQDLMLFLKENNFNPLRAKLLYHEDGKSKGSGFVQMPSNFEAQRVIDSLNNQNFQGRNLRVNMAQHQGV